MMAWAGPIRSGPGTPPLFCRPEGSRVLTLRSPKSGPGPYDRICVLHIFAHPCALSRSERPARALRGTDPVETGRAHVSDPAVTARSTTLADPNGRTSVGHFSGLALPTHSARARHATRHCQTDRGTLHNPGGCPRPLEPPRVRRGRTLADPKPALSRNPDPAVAFPFMLTAALPTNTPRRPSGQPSPFGGRIDARLAGDVNCGWPVCLFLPAAPRRHRATARRRRPPNRPPTTPHATTGHGI